MLNLRYVQPYTLTSLFTSYSRTTLSLTREVFGLSSSSQRQTFPFPLTHSLFYTLACTVMAEYVASFLQ